MDRPRFSLVWRLGMVVFLAVALAAMRTTSAYWTAMAGTVTLGLLLTNVVGGLFLGGPNWTLWAGFAVLGWVYRLFDSWDWVGAPFGHDLARSLSDLPRTVLPDRTSPSSRSFGRLPGPPIGGALLLDQLQWRTLDR